MKSIASLHRRTVLAASLAAAAFGLVALPAQAQTFPSKGLRIVVPFGPGGVGDLTARIVAEKLTSQLGQPVVIDNRPGAGGVVAAESVARSEPDGYTMFLMSNGTAVTASLFNKLPFDTIKDFTPVSTLGYFDIAVVVPANSPHKTLADLVKFAKANPGKINIGSINIGSTQHLAAELFKSTAGIDAQIVPYNGSPALIGAIRGQQVDVAVEILAPVLTQIQGGALRALAVTGEKRSIVLPDVPTAVEAGVKDYIASSWNALAVPSKTPRAVVERLNKEIVTAVADPGVREKLRNLNIDARSSTPEQNAALLASDIRRWSGVIERAKIQKQ
ncbi:Bug family tripartite tricarboxylate transporter substrate binding protein [Hydrogenophaga sp. BPS33]|uniref:Bug family tripartite tricarboxylate transporter substrate binding protein n=1 Tax=Hydrogenophaga sp. BPS33 TaxID=2651974 RepID=UPI0013202906|nr:tripartite tricarboxylate transporter substrate binding protein [Hydrogenophaga sp. BPS33]QHE85602.1 tripartite tricarboxylate transporter substrate binding protein [Hydrogenophaga sp. BPS33]